MQKKKLFLIDGNAILYRSYYAIRQLVNSKGFATNAIYGFLNTLKKLNDKEDIKYLGIAFDTKAPTFRHKMYNDYKANRKPMPEDLVTQVPVLKKVLQALNTPCFEKPGFEADDILGSLAGLAEKKGIHTVIVSSDKDLFQLVNPSISIFNPAKDVYLNETAIKDSFGASPSQVVDVLTLWGDSIDNIPGIPGIGEKTAKKLLSRFGSLDNLTQNLNQIKNPRVKKQIEENLDLLKLNRKLVTLKKDMKINFELEDFAITEPDYNILIPLLQELEFSSLISAYMKKSDAREKSYTTILTEEELQKLVTDISKTGFVSLDTETDSPFPNQARLVGMSFATRSGKASYLPLRHDHPGTPAQVPLKTALRHLKQVLISPKIKKIGQNIKYDYIVLKKEGITLKGIDLDTMLLSYLTEPNWGQHNLNRLSLRYLHVNPIPYNEIVGKGKNEVTMNAVEIERAAPYACQDADLALQLSSILWPGVKEKNLDSLYRDLELPLIEVLAGMEMWGVSIDTKVLAAISSELSEHINRLKKKIYAHSSEEFNLNSPQQLAEILFHKLKLPAAKKTKKTRGYSTSLEVLQKLAKDYPIAQYMLEYRKLSKLKSTYADSLPKLINQETGRIHTSYNQTVAATGRLSSSNPNLQNIPARGPWGPRFRQAFIPESGYLFLSADYSQIELRVLAHMSEDPTLIETFRQNRDIHQETVNQVFGGKSSLFENELRQRAKIINFSILYGTSAFSLAKELNTSNLEAQKFINLYFARYPRVREYLDKCIKDATEKGYSETLLGRKRQVPELKQKNKLTRQAGQRIAVNTPIQGTAADLIKKAMIEIWQEIKRNQLKTKMVLQVHDELVFEVPKAEYDIVEEIVQKKMENVLPLKVPLKVHLGWGVNWADAK